MLENIQSLLTIVATGTGIFAVVTGLQAWKRELTGRRDIELCQKVIELFYEAEQEIKKLRSAFSYPEVESKERPKHAAETDKEKKLRDDIYVPLARFYQQQEFWVEFFAHKFRMRALFGLEGANPFNIVDEVLRGFKAAATTRYNCIQGDKLELDADTRQNFEAKIWEISEDDETNKNIERAIGEMEEICIPVVRSKSALFDQLIRRVTSWRGRSSRV